MNRGDTRPWTDDIGAARQGLAEFLSELGFPVPYAERIARELVELGNDWAGDDD